jgi:hypothetical protein
MYPDPAAPMDLRHLAYGEHLLVWSFRAFAVGRYDCPLIVREYGDACGDLAREARIAVQVFAQEVEMQGRRQICLGHPGRLGLTRDEQLLLAIFGAAQHGEEDRCTAHLTWLLAKPPSAPFYAAASVVAQALALKGHWFGDAASASPRRPAMGRETPGIPSDADDGRRLRWRHGGAVHLNSSPL